MDVHGGKDAAVLVPLFDDPAALHAVFTRRRDDLRRHAGEISFPGGRRDDGEELLDTALREAHEEIGLPPAATSTVVGALAADAHVRDQLRDLSVRRPDRARLAWVLAADRGRRGARAVARRAAGRLRRAAAGAAAACRSARPPTRSGGHVIWGATARILGDLLAA